LALAIALFSTAGCQRRVIFWIAPPVVSAPLFREPVGELERVNAATLKRLLDEAHLGVTMCPNAGPHGRRWPSYPPQAGAAIAQLRARSVVFSPDGLAAVVIGEGDGLQIYRANSGASAFELVHTAELPQHLRSFRWNDEPRRPFCRRKFRFHGFNTRETRWYGGRFVYFPAFGGDVVYDVASQKWSVGRAAVWWSTGDEAGVYQVIDHTILGPAGERFPLATGYLKGIARDVVIFTDDRVQNFRTGEVFEVTGMTRKLMPDPSGRRVASRSRISNDLCIWEFKPDGVSVTEIILPKLYRFDIFDWSIDPDWMLARIWYPKQRYPPWLLLIHIPSKTLYQIRDARGPSTGDGGFPRLFRYCGRWPLIASAASRTSAP